MVSTCTRSVFFAILTIVLTAPVAFGQTSATASASANANIVPGISIVNDTALNFGDFLSPTTAGPHTVSLTAAAPTTQTPSAGVTPAGGTINAAQFTVTGAGTKSFGVTMPASVTIGSGANNMTVNGFVSNCPSNVCALGGTAGTTQTFTLQVGATLNIAQNQPVGAYTNTFQVTVAYQ